MTRTGFHLLLILTLALNGIAAPWVMGATNHRSHSGHVAHEHGTAAGSVEVQLMPQHHHSARMHAQMHNTVAPTTDDRMCCDGATCACGCVLPPAMLFSGTPAMRQAIATLSAPVIYDRLSATLNTPPFRPPTI